MTRRLDFHQGSRRCPALLRNMIFNRTRPSRITPPFYSYNPRRRGACVYERGKARSTIEAAAREEARESSAIIPT